MSPNSLSFQKASVRTVIVLAALTVAACAQRPSAPQQVQASNPSVTYKYRNDQELVQANQNATTFCSGYQSVPRTVQFASDPDGSRVVVFECVQSLPMQPPPQQFNPNLAYTYRSDQELLDASRNAQIYCRNNGSPQVLSNIVTNANGTRTVTFQCSPR